VKGNRRAYCTSCYTGNYPVAFPRDESGYLQLSLKIDGKREPLPEEEPRRSAKMRSSPRACYLFIRYLLLLLRRAGAWPTPASPEQIRAAIDKLADLDYDTRMAAARTIRRAPSAQSRAGAAAGGQRARGRLRSLPGADLLTGYSRSAHSKTHGARCVSPNDRLREVAYAYFEQNPRPPLAPKMLAALDKEEGEFVRPAPGAGPLRRCRRSRKVAAVLDSDAAPGLDFFAAPYRASATTRSPPHIPRLIEIAKSDGPLQDDSGDGARQDLRQDRASAPCGAAAVRAEGNAPPRLPPPSAVGHQLFGSRRLSRKDAHLRGHLSGLPVPAFAAPPLDSATSPGRASRKPCGSCSRRRALAGSGPRAVTLAVGLVALRNTPLMLKTLQARADQTPPSGWSPKPSTCSKKTSKRNGSSSRFAVPTGRPPTRRR
jgi:hypothetical protein